MPSSDCFGFSSDDGLVEFAKDLGEPVSKGEIVARIHPVGRTGATPAEHRAAIDGLLAGRHFPGLIKAGDCLAVIATAENDLRFGEQSGNRIQPGLLKCSDRRIRS